ncbi:MAG: formylglycine-generating enzyme family protein [Planctomycetes bacterium]|nr:formylglycine-generating enzyme family protein [Planctomycetota bacterium]
MDYLSGRLLKGQPEEVVAIRAALGDHKHDLQGGLWNLLENPKVDHDERLRAACALADYDPDNRRWEQVSGNVSAMLIKSNPLVLGKWTEALRPVKTFLLPHLAALLEDEKQSVSKLRLIAEVYKSYAHDDATVFAALEKKLEEVISPDPAATAAGQSQSNTAVALLLMERGDKVWPLFKHRSDPTVRSFLIERIGPGGVDPTVLVARLRQETDVSARRALLLSLGRYDLDGLPLAERQKLLPTILSLYQDDPDPGIHGAAEWLLRQWQAADRIKAIDGKLATGGIHGQRRWYINRQGQALMLIQGPVQFDMGIHQDRHKQNIKRSYLIASKEVTVEQFQRFRKDHPLLEKLRTPSNDCPMNSVSWYDAAAYCNWLNEQEGIARDQWCYEPNTQGEYANGMKLAPDLLRRTGYRLPTQAEWEFACRAGAGPQVGFSFGLPTHGVSLLYPPEDLIRQYAWYSGNSQFVSHPVGSLKPNDFGLFDMHGNVWEWCQHKYHSFKFGEVLDDEGVGSPIVFDKERREIRGGSFHYGPATLRCGHRGYTNEPPSLKSLDKGFRLARTQAP